MKSLEVRRIKPTRPDAQELEAQIIARRQEYALGDSEAKHIYLGFIEGDVEQLLDVVSQQVEQFRQRFPTASFTLEYHPSCIAHQDYPFEVYSFSLIQDATVNGQRQREVGVVSWLMQAEQDVDEVNLLIESTMAYLRVRAYDDGSGVSCRVLPGITVLQ